LDQQKHGIYDHLQTGQDGSIRGQVEKRVIRWDIQNREA